MGEKTSIKRNFIEQYFILLVLLVTGIALWQPSGFVWMKPHIPKLLGLIMFGMGVSLTFNDFKKIKSDKHLLLLGISMQFMVMPLLALILSFSFQLPEEILTGMILVGACPGGTASNVMAYLSKANLVLSVSLTLLSTLLAPIITPAIVYLLLSKHVEISFLSMMKSIFWVVIFPLFGGLVFRHFIYKFVPKFLSWFPTVSMVCIALIIGSVVALNQELLLTFPVLIILAVIMHNSLGMSIGYGVARLFKASKENARTLAFEVGMQNSGLGVSLATQFFSAASALPGAIFSVVHNISGVTMASRVG
jgi:bile acid:Na+ symporter, BASS family